MGNTGGHHHGVHRKEGGGSSNMVAPGATFSPGYYTQGEYFDFTNAQQLQRAMEQDEDSWCLEQQDMRPRASTITQGTTLKPHALPVVFKWANDSNAKTVLVSGSFDNWKTKIPLVKSHGDFTTILEIPEGEHEFKFLVDGQWKHDSSLPARVSNGNKNNLITVKNADYEVFEALAMDMSSNERESQLRLAANDVPDGEYGQRIPGKAGAHVSGPPTLPPHLLQVILNQDISTHYEPNLLPEPNHVMLNHLYALSIKDGVMVLSATHRYRKKFVTSVYYKPIDG